TVHHLFYAGSIDRVDLELSLFRLGQELRIFQSTDESFLQGSYALLGHLWRERIESLSAVKLAGDAEKFFSFVRLGVIDGERDALQLGMRLEHRLEHDMNLFVPQRVGPSHLRRLPAKGAGTVDFPGFRRNPNVGGTLVALDQLQGEIRGGGEELGIIGSAGAGADRTQLDPRLGLAPILCRSDPAAFGRY